MLAPACHQAEAAILAFFSSLQNYRGMFLLFVSSSIVILIAIATTLEVAVFPFFRCRWCLCCCEIAVALVHSQSIALTPDAFPPAGLGGGFCSGANRALQPAQDSGKSR